MTYAPFLDIRDANEHIKLLESQKATMLEAMDNLVDRAEKLEAQLKAHEQGVGWEVFREDFVVTERENTNLKTINAEMLDALERMRQHANYGNRTIIEGIAIEAIRKAKESQ